MIELNQFEDEIYRITKGIAKVKYTDLAFKIKISNQASVSVINEVKGKIQKLKNFGTQQLSMALSYQGEFAETESLRKVSRL